MGGLEAPPGDQQPRPHAQIQNPGHCQRRNHHDVTPTLHFALGDGRAPQLAHLQPRGGLWAKQRRQRQREATLISAETSRYAKPKQKSGAGFLLIGAAAAAAFYIG